MTRALVAKVVALIYATAGRHLDELHVDAWQIALDDLDDGDDVLPVVRRLTRQLDFVTAKDAWQAVKAEREQAARRSEYQPVAEAVAELETSTATWHLDDPIPETPAEWTTHIRAVLGRARGPLAVSLRQTVTLPRPDETYFDELTRKPRSDKEEP